MIKGSAEKTKAFVLDWLNAHLNNRIRLFPRGWGSPWVLERAGTWLDRVEPIRIEWGEAVAVPGGTHRRGRFRSPYADWGLPPEAREAHVEMLLPHGWSKKTPMNVQFPSTGDEFCHRARAAALAMLRHGIGSLVLEVAFYGARKPAEQFSTYLRWVSDLWLMGMAAWEEGRSLLAWLKTEGFERLGVSGISMGGTLASHVATKWPEPLAVACSVAPHNAGVVYAGSVLADVVDWPRLSRGTPDPRQRMREVFAPTDLRRFAVPVRPDACVRLGARHDLYVPPATVRVAHACWPGSKLYWTDGGHVQIVAWRGHLLAGLMEEAFERL